MNLFNKTGVLCLAIFMASMSLATTSIAHSAPSNGRIDHPAKKASEIFQDKSVDLRDYEISWNKIPTSDPQIFLPEMPCDLSKKYFELSSRSGFKAPTVPPRNPLDFDKNLDDYDQKGVMPWPGILGHWQDWNSGIYLEIQRVKEIDLDNHINDYMVLKLYSMCTDELLSESATLVQNSTLNQTLKVPTISYGLKLSAGQMNLKVLHFEGIPNIDELEIEIHHVDSFTKDAKRVVLRVFRFL